MALIDLVKWNSIPGVYVWKFPSDELSTATQLIVAESQEAVLFKDGKLIQSFSAGRYTLDTKNFPILTELFRLPFGGQSPFKAEVWFINKAISLDIKWGTVDPIQLMDPKYQIMLPVRAFGQFGIQIENGVKFLVKLVGTLSQYDVNTLSSHFKGIVVTQVKDSIAKKLVKENISILEINAHLSDISQYLQQETEGDLATFGLTLMHFKVLSINAPEDDPSVMQLKAALSKRAEMNIVGYSYQQERSFNTMDSAASNTGAAIAGPMGAGMGLGMGIGIGGTMGGALGGMANQMQFAAPIASCPKCNAQIPNGGKFCLSCGTPIQLDTPKQKMIQCDKCGEKSPEGTMFCPKCGDPFNPCPNCGSDNPESAVICNECKKPLPVKCTCGTPVPASSKFCPSCGKSMVLTCSKCNEVVTLGTKFCSHCGNTL